MNNTGEMGGDDEDPRNAAQRDHDRRFRSVVWKVILALAVLVWTFIIFVLLELYADERISSVGRVTCHPGSQFIGTPVCAEARGGKP